MVTPTQEQRQNIEQLLKTYQSDPDLFVSVASATDTGKKVLDAIQRYEFQRQHQSGNLEPTHISEQQVLHALEVIDASNYHEARREYDNNPHIETSEDAEPESMNVYTFAMIPLVEYARQQMVNRDPNLYVLQDSRSMADGRMLFWSEKARGYTTDLERAHRFTKQEAIAQNEDRETDIPHRVGDLSPASPSMREAAARDQVAQSKKHSAATPKQFNEPATKPIDANAVDTLSLEDRFSKLDRGTDIPVVVIHRADGSEDIETIMIDPPAYLMEGYIKNHDYQVEQTNLATLAARFWTIHNVQDALSYYNWQLLSNFMADGLGSIESDGDNLSEELTDSLVSDVPERLAVKRLDLFDRHATPASTPGKMRLVELVMASRYGEPVNKSLFTNETFNHPERTWRSIVEGADFGHLVEWSNSVEHDLNQIELEMKHLHRNPQHTTNAERADRLTELTFQRDCLEYEQEEIALLDDQMHSHIARLERQNRQAEQTLPALDDDLDDEPEMRMGQ